MRKELAEEEKMSLNIRGGRHFQQRAKSNVSGVVILLFMFGVLLATLMCVTLLHQETVVWKKCNDDCSIILAESIPLGLTYPPGSPSHPSIYHTWLDLIEMATESIDIASFYWTLKGTDIHDKDPSDYEGENIYNALLKAGTDGGIAIRIAENKPSEDSPDEDTVGLQKAGAADVHILDFDKLMGGGVLHTKLWIVDRKHVFIGSPNMDWRSLTQVKELGVAFINCSCVAEDTAKLFDVYWDLGRPGAKIPSSWPANLSTPYNQDTPMEVSANGTELNVYLSSAPPQFCPDGRANDIDAILDVMNNAEHFIHIAVMDYYPYAAYKHPQTYWPVIDDKLRSLAFNRKISVRLLASYWEHSEKEMIGFLRSLAILNTTGIMDIQVKLFVVPATPAQAKIPYARVNHNKYMVTDKQAYIGTSNWSEDYFVDTGGVGVIVNETKSAGNQSAGNQGFRQQLADVFERDWNSEYASFVSDLSVY
ncbi:5'-3' exonuclease PLD3-like [Asterias amurensis]|uniref:5'-3' exonuclease PLD3-like n=1 Tax=Asterias amurensis TaxID=7602 RepID=UPI003AB2FE1A